VKTESRIAIPILCLLTLAAGARPVRAAVLGSGLSSPSPQGSPPAPIEGIRFVHVATAANVDGDTTTMSHPRLNGHPFAIVVVTQVWNPLGGPGTYNDHPVGVDYDEIEERWGIYNEDGTDLAEGAGFHVLILEDGEAALIHLSSELDTTANWTEITYGGIHQLTTARVFATHVFNPWETPGTLHPYNVGVFYDDPKWAVYNEGGYLMGLGVGFNIAAGIPTPNAYLHVANGGNTSLNTTVLDHPDLNDNPRAWVLVSHNWSPGLPPTVTGADGEGVAAGDEGVYLDATLGVFYSSGLGRWLIFDQAGKGGSIPLDAAFNVLVDPHPSIYIDDFESGGYLNWSAWAP